jgi:hypothetical protein
MCVACGMRLSATAAPAPKAEEPAAAPMPVPAKTTFGMMSPIAAKPAAAKPAAQPAKSAWGMPKPASKSQPIPTQQPSQETAPAAEPVPAKTMFGVGMAVQPAPKVTSPSKPVLEALAQNTTPAPEPVLPKTMFGVGVAAVSAPSAPSFEPEPQAMPPEEPYQAEPEPAPQPIQNMEPLVQRSPEAPKVTALQRSPAPDPGNIGLAETMPAPEAPAVKSGAALASIQEKDFLGADVELPRTPAPVEGSDIVMPDAPASPEKLLFYFFKVLGARVDLLVKARELEAETKLWQDRVGYLLATIGLRSASASSDQIRTLQSKITELLTQQQTMMGERGARLKAFDEREHELNRDIADREGSYATLQLQLKDIEAVRKDLQNQMKQPMPPLELADKLTKTDGPFNNLKTQTEAARIALQDARAKYNATVKEKKQMLKDGEAQMKSTNAQLAALRDELKKQLQAAGQEALLQGAASAASCKGEIDAVNQGISARQAMSQKLRDQITAVNQSKFLQGAGAFGGVLLVIFVILYMIKPG